MRCAAGRATAMERQQPEPPVCLLSTQRRHSRFPADHLSLGPEYRLSACSDICARPYNNENRVNKGSWDLYKKTPLKQSTGVYGTFRFLVTDTLIKTNRNDTATIRVISFKNGYLRNNGASPNPNNAPTNAPTKPTAILVMLNILSNLRRPGSIPTTIPVMSINIINIVSLPYHLKLDTSATGRKRTLKL